MSKALRRVAAYLPRRVAFAALAPMERRLLAAAPEEGPLCVFVIGPPRSGTTLVFDLIVSRFRCAYFSTLANRLWRTPAAATKLGARTIRGYRARYESTYGHIAAWGGPNEGGEIWKSWYDETKVLTETDVPFVDAERIQRTIRSVSTTLGGPFVSKNVMHGLHMPFLDALFPGCLFVEVRRSRVEIARSLLRARREMGGDSGIAEWISIRPPGYEEYLGASPVTQVCAQIVLTQSHLARETARLGAERVLTVEYDRVCAEPEDAMTEFASWVTRASGEQLSMREFEAPNLNRSSSKPLDAATEGEIERELARLGDMHEVAA